ncbi:MAG: phosphodiester glycosidase family protein, partial [Actinomycetota bacterium]|nr:phosphodiester glycosidase family protein [Actinomycetota bacterium]
MLVAGCAHPAPVAGAGPTISPLLHAPAAAAAATTATSAPPSTTRTTTTTLAPAPSPSPSTVVAGGWQPLGQSSLLDALVTPTGEVIRIDPTRLEVAVVPGTSQPGGTFPEGARVPVDRRAALVLATNAGFKRADARGGELVDGQTVGGLVPGAASLVIRGNGSLDVGAWGTSVSPSPDVTAVLQNLTLLVDHGQPAPDLGTNIIQRWGVSFRPALPVSVWRSGAGVDAQGRLLYAAAANVVPAQLAQLLIDAGAVRAMQLDINHLWVFAALFFHPDPQHPELLQSRLANAGMGPSPDHVLAPGERDFLAV